MKLPQDWDKPSEDNEELCARFTFHTYEHHGRSLPYRLFQAETDRELPLVIYLHGADVVGDDNRLPLSIHDIGTMFARDDWQREHSCHILAPQYGRGQYWSVEWVKEAVLELIGQSIRKLGADQRRIYIYGYSAGGVGTFRFVKEFPELFAAALSICGATDSERMYELARIPLWMVHAVDDGIVKAYYPKDTVGNYRHMGSGDLYHVMHEMAPLMKYTEYPAGYMKKQYGVNPHCSWVCVSDPENPEFGKWLFEQTRG